MMNFRVARGPLLEAGVATRIPPFGPHQWHSANIETRRDEVIDLRDLDKRNYKYVTVSY